MGNDKTKIKNAVGIFIVAVGLRYSKINTIPISSSLNFIQQLKRLNSYIEEDIQLINTNSKVIKTRFKILINN